MKNTLGTAKQIQDRVTLLGTVRTPLGFFTLVVLVVESILGVTATFSQGPDRTYLIVGMISLIFSLVLIVAILTLLKPESLVGKDKKKTNDYDLSPVQRIARYQQLIQDETRANLLANFKTPSGYKAEISNMPKFVFGFCYPKDWTFSYFPEQLHYGIAKDHSSAQQIGFVRNVNVLITHITSQDGDLQTVYENTPGQTLSLLPNSKLIFHDTQFVIQGLLASKYQINWTPNTDPLVPLSLYQILVGLPEKDMLYILSFTTTQDDIEASRPTFDNILNTFRF